MRSSTGRDPARTLHDAADLRRSLAALSIYVALGAWAHGRVGRRERRAFAKVNHDTAPQPLLRVPQQLGTPWVLPGLAVLGFLTHRPHLAVTAAAALPLEKALEVGVKKLFHRDRPSKADPRADLEDDAPVEGSSYPSGHAVAAPPARLNRPRRGSSIGRGDVTGQPAYAGRGRARAGPAPGILAP